GLLPLFEALSWLSFLSGLVGLSFLALAASKRLPRAYEDLSGIVARFGTLAPFRLVGDTFRFLAEGTGKGLGGRVARSLLAWIMPIAFAAAFLLLFASANPLIENVLNAIRLDSLDKVLDPLRIALWGVVAVMVWPLLRPKLLPWTNAPMAQGPVRPRAESLIFGRAAILRSLVVFNALFAVQTALDILYLWGGVRLPDGMTYADYAHRGAYPLIVTAFLAAGFVLAAMRKGGAAEASPLIRTLVYLWIGQNVLLVISSILRLDLYVEVYSLTELRLAAGIWMGLVAIGLMLILWKIQGARSNKWLVTSNLVALGIVLYGCAFIDFSALIARFNVENSRELGGEGQPVDAYYLDGLGPAAIPALMHYVENARGRTEDELREFRLLASNLAEAFLAQSTDWRSWSFRNQRLRDFLRAAPEFASLEERVINEVSHE
ncbi:MAG TPA: DUF4173 domain-containing protein, partial [Devosia sp.]